ncbi:MAG: hypothetical protein ACLQDY_30070 [Streptosporangiaceae bacterium]
MAIWPDDAALSLWALPPGDLAVALFQPVESGTGAAAYWADAMQSAVRLAVTAPPAGPASAREFLERLEAGWLHTAWAGSQAVPARVAADARHLVRADGEAAGPGTDRDIRRPGLHQRAGRRQVHLVGSGVDERDGVTGRREPAEEHQVAEDQVPLQAQVARQEYPKRLAGLGSRGRRGPVDQHRVEHYLLVAGADLVPNIQ